MIPTTLAYRMRLNRFLYAAEKLTGHQELPPQLRRLLLNLTFALIHHTEQLYPANEETPS